MKVAACLLMLVPLVYGASIVIEDTEMDKRWLFGDVAGYIHQMTAHLIGELQGTSLTGHALEQTCEHTLCPNALSTVIPFGGAIGGAVCGPACRAAEHALGKK